MRTSCRATLGPRLCQCQCQWIALLCLIAPGPAGAETAARSSAGNNARAADSRAAGSADWLYTVRPGDRLWTIARRFCRDKDCDRAILARNGMKGAADLQAGRVIAIPVPLLLRTPVAAHVASVNGAAFLERGNAPRRPLQKARPRPSNCQLRPTRVRRCARCAIMARASPRRTCRICFARTSRRQPNAAAATASAWD